jgi:hypothetical protein
MESHRIKHRAAVEKWKRANYAYYLAQKRALASRPSYLARRREMYKAKRSDLELLNLSTGKSQNEYSKQVEGSNRRIDCEPDAAEGT